MSWCAAIVVAFGLVALGWTPAGATGHANDLDWVVLLHESERDTAWDGAAAVPPGLPGLGELGIPAAADMPPDPFEVAVRESADMISFRVRSHTTSEGPVPSEAAGPAAEPERARFALHFVLDHTAVASEADDRDVEGAYVLEVDLQGLATLSGTGTGTGEGRYQIASDERPWNFTLDVPKRDTLDAGTLQIGDKLRDAWAEFQVEDGAGRSATDRLPDQGVGGAYSIAWAPGASAPIPTWGTVAGTDFAAGPDSAFDPDDDLYVSYLVYRGEGGTATGAYLGAVTAAGITPTRVGDVSFPSDLHEDGTTRTALTATADALHMVYHPEPGATHGAAAVAYVRGTIGSGGGIGQVGSAENPASAPGARAPFDGFAGQPDVAASAGRTVVCYATSEGDGVSIVERTADGTWSLVRNLSDARFCRLELDQDDRLHVAWFRETDDTREVFEGELVYATETNDWTETKVTGGLRDQTTFWETAEVNGGFDFDLDDQGRPAFVYDREGTFDDRGGPMYARLVGGNAEEERAPGLVPGHGNPQLTVWMDHDADGFMHVATGYGGLDSYGMRSPDGRWYFDTDLERTDVFSLAADSEGRATIAGTQPHGGTTLEVVQTSFRAEPVLAPAGPGPAHAIPGPMPIMIVGAVAALLAAAPRTLRVAADRAPVRVAPAFAFVGGFSRLRRNRMLDHDTRGQIVSAIEADPGAPPARLQRQLGIPRSTLFYHLRRLEEERLIRVQRAGRQMMLLPARPASAKPPAVVLEREQQLLEMTRMHPGQPSGFYAAELGWHPRTVHERLRQLERRELVSRDRVGPRDVRWQFVGGPDDVDLRPPAAS